MRLILTHLAAYVAGVLSVLVYATALAFVSVSHFHKWGDWTQEQFGAVLCNTRRCKTCGFVEVEKVDEVSR